MMKLATVLACLWTISARADPLTYLGVNLSGAEFGVPGEFRHRYDLGRLGTTYIFPPRAEIESYADSGFNIARVLFAWERLQHEPYASLDAAYLSGLDGVVRDAAAKRMVVILEPGNLGYGYGGLIGTEATPNSAFADLWRRIAEHYAGRTDVMFGLMNEPHDQAPEEWLHSAQAAIDAIRATGARQEILVPGTYYSQGASWLSRGNATAFADRITDPANTIAFEVHQYTDADQSGRSPIPVSPTIGAERLARVTAWAEATGKRLFLAEFGAGRDEASIEAMRNQLRFVQAHSGVWQGAAIWGGGPWWPADYPLGIEPVSSPQLLALREFLPRKSATPPPRPPSSTLSPTGL